MNEYPSAIWKNPYVFVYNQYTVVLTKMLGHKGMPKFMLHMKKKIISNGWMSNSERGNQQPNSTLHHTIHNLFSYTYN